MVAPGVFGSSLVCRDVVTVTMSEDDTVDVAALDTVVVEISEDVCCDVDIFVVDGVVDVDVPGEKVLQRNVRLDPASNQRHRELIVSLL